MRLYRFKQGKKAVYGVLREERLQVVSGSIFRSIRETGESIPIGDVRLLPPVVPSKIVAVGRNYKDHAAEMGNPLPVEPLLFMKPPSAVIGPEDVIVYPGMAKRVDFEGELAVVIRKTTAGLKDDDPVEDNILGYTICNDVTARDLQKKDGQFTRAKGFDTFAPLGPCISTDIDPGRLHLKSFLNGKLRQSAGTKNLIFSIPFLVRFISRIMTLVPGDVISTGTPAGVGPMSPGDRIDIQIEGIGVLSNRLMKVR